MKLSFRSILLLSTLFFYVHCQVFSQENYCALDIGGEDVETLIAIFQLNDEQQSLLEKWRGELLVQSRLIQDEIDQLLADHPQSTEADLRNLAKKYGNLKNKLIRVSAEYDQRLLGVFNDKQYDFYVELCREALRSPLNPIPKEEDKEDP